MDIVKGIRPLDHVLTLVMVALAAVLAYANMTAGADYDVAHPLDSHSALMIPVFVLAALPILVRRRAILPAIGVSFVVVAASVPAFGWVTRCGFALPLAIAMAYAVARFAPGAQIKIIGVVGVIALQVVTLIKDSSTGGLSGLSVGLPLAALAYGVGAFVQARAEKTSVDVPAVQHVHA